MVTTVRHALTVRYCSENGPWHFEHIPTICIVLDALVVSFSLMFLFLVVGQHLGEGCVAGIFLMEVLSAGNEEKSFYFMSILEGTAGPCATSVSGSVRRRAHYCESVGRGYLQGLIVVGTAQHLRWRLESVHTFAPFFERQFPVPIMRVENDEQNAAATSHIEFFFSWLLCPFSATEAQEMLREARTSEV